MDPQRRFHFIASLAQLYDIRKCYYACDRLAFNADSMLELVVLQTSKWRQVSMYKGKLSTRSTSLYGSLYISHGTVKPLHTWSARSHTLTSTVLSRLKGITTVKLNVSYVLRAS